MEVYQPPTPDSSRPETALQADDIERSKAKPIVGAAAAAMVVGGIGAVLLSLQMLTGFRVRGLFVVLLYALLALGIGNIAVGSQLRRALKWTANASIAASGALALTSMVWGVAALMSLVFSPLTLMACGGSLLATILSLVARSSVIETAAARARLRAEGWDLGT